MAFVTTGSGGVFKTVNRSSQKPPFVQPLPYYAYGGTQTDTRGMVTSGEFSIWGAGRVQGSSADSSLEVIQAKAKAYDKLFTKIKGEASAMLATNIAERQQASAMMLKRVLQLRNCYSHLKTFQFSKFLRELGFKRKSQKGNPSQWVRQGKNRSYTLSEDRVQRDSRALVRGSKSVSALWLEYHFGWSPLLSDIYGALEVQAGGSPVYVNTKFHAMATVSGNYNDAYPPYQLTESQHWDCGVRYQCEARVKSAELLKLSQVGLVNPLSVAWEVVPFSFVIDWFVPVGRFLESMTDSVGLDISKVQCAHSRKYRGEQLVGGPYGYVLNATAFHFHREVLGSLPVPGLFDRRGTGIKSLARGATAVALLVGFLKSR